MKKILHLLLYIFIFIPSLYAQDAWDRIEKTGEILWGADTSGGAPYVFIDSSDPSKVIGFEIDLMNAVAAKLNLKHKLVVVQWDQLVPALLRKDFDIIVNGLEITEDRNKVIDFTIPYYIFSQQITTRINDNRFNKFEDMRNHKIGTYSATLAQRMLEQDGKITIVTYPSPIEMFQDLEIGRIDAAFQDLPIAAWYTPLNSKLQNSGDPIGQGFYAGATRKDCPKLKAKFNEALHSIIISGELKKIYVKWNMWTNNQKQLYKLAENENLKTDKKSSIKKFVPLLLKGALMTIVLSCLSMLIAIILGFLICIGKLYGSKPVKIICNTYIEIIRGTPLLIQLYLLYYGLPNIGIELNAFAAALIGMGLNYAAYESEIYRAGLLSIPKGQTEAAHSLGMSAGQTLRYILLPQAIRTILPPSTNDFIALFKDTSIVSIITVTELTRSYSQAATATYRFLELGLLTAALYLIMSFPLSLWSRSMEKKHNVTVHHS